MPAAAGVPVIAPVTAFNARPGGRTPPASENQYGAVPPVTVTAELYGVPTFAVEEAQESSIFALFTFTIHLNLIALPLLLAAVTV